MYYTLSVLNLCVFLFKTFHEPRVVGQIHTVETEDINHIKCIRKTLKLMNGNDFRCIL